MVDSFYIVLLALPVLLLLLCWYKFAYSPFQHFRRLGIPHPPVTPFFGNALQLRQLSIVNAIDKWIKEYGKVTGYYLGAFPRLIVADLDIVKEIMVKQFDKFTDRSFASISIGNIAARNDIPPDLFMMKGKEWKMTRPIVSPTFTAKKLKLMEPHIVRSCKSLNERISELRQSGQSTDLWRIFGQFTMETILATAFGRQVNVLKGEGDELTEAAGGIFSMYMSGAIMWNGILRSHFPYFQNFTRFFARGSKFAANYNKLVDLSLKLVELRTESVDSFKDKDFLQLLIEARAEDSSEELISSSKRRLTKNEIVSICIGFLLAGYETTSNCLAFTSYLLALNTDKQDKLCQIIEDYFQENPEATLYDASQNIQYLDWVISESLRMYPPAPRTARSCTESCVIKGINFSKDVLVYIPIQYFHYSTEYWDEPDTFRPERFSPEEKEGRHPLCYMPFGLGPRNCVGMRFALMEAKMALVSILREFKFQTAPDTEIPLKTTTGITQVPVNGIYLNIIKKFD